MKKMHDSSSKLSKKGLDISSPDLAHFVPQIYPYSNLHYIKGDITCLGEYTVP